jgi:transposase
MTKLTQKVDFFGHTIYIGLDVHKLNWQVSLYYEGKNIKNFSQPASTEALLKHLRDNYPGANYVCAYECGFSGFWIYRELQSQGVDCLVVNAADVPQTDKGLKNKTDKVDASRLGMALQAGFLVSVYVPSTILDADRQLVRSNNRFTSDLTRYKNRIKGLLHYLGISIPEKFAETSWSNAFIQWLKELKVEEDTARKVLDFQIEMMVHTRQQKVELTKQIKNLLNEPRYCALTKLLFSVPGVGHLTAATLLTEIGDMDRFSCLEKLNSFVGFCPTSHSSGEKERNGHITKRHNRFIRMLLIEASWKAIKSDPALMKVYAALKAKIGGKRAIVKIARKLLNRIRYVWVNKQEYVNGVIQ